MRLCAYAVGWGFLICWGSFVLFFGCNFWLRFQNCCYVVSLLHVAAQSIWLHRQNWVMNKNHKVLDLEVCDLLHATFVTTNFLVHSIQIATFRKFRFMSYLKFIHYFVGWYATPDKIILLAIWWPAATSDKNGSGKSNQRFLPFIFTF